MINCSIVKHDDCVTQDYTYWCGKLGVEPRPSRKQWEDIQIVRALYERDCLAPGKKGLGFGVGREPLVSLFAALGCDMLATDQALNPQVQRDWRDTGQHSMDADELYRAKIISRKDFDTRVRFEVCDMNHIPESYHDRFDFTYSACSMDHVGSLELATEFFINSLRCLKPGGWAVHTTEFNLLAVNPKFRGRTTEAGPTVFFRQFDIERLAARVESAGYRMVLRDYSRGAHAEDFHIDFEPHQRSDSHLLLQVCTGDESGGGGWIVTSIILIAQRPE